MSELSRRVFLGTTGLVAGAAGLGAATEVDQTYEGARGPRKSCRPSGSRWNKTRDTSPTAVRPGKRP